MQVKLQVVFTGTDRGKFASQKSLLILTYSNNCDSNQQKYLYSDPNLMDDWSCWWQQGVFQSTSTRYS